MVLFLWPSINILTDSLPCFHPNRVPFAIYCWLGVVALLFITLFLLPHSFTHLYILYYSILRSNNDIIQYYLLLYQMSRFYCIGDGCFLFCGVWPGSGAPPHPPARRTQPAATASRATRSGVL
jgi:hypothetical protein